MSTVTETSKKPTLTQTVAELKELVGAQEALIEGLIRDNNRLVAFAEKAAPFLNELRNEHANSQTKPPFKPTNSAAPQPQQQAQQKQQAKPAIKTLPRQPQSTPAASPAQAMYDQYKTAVKAHAMQTGKSVNVIPFGKASTMKLEDLMATIS